MTHTLLKAEVAERFRVSTRTVDRWRATGKLRSLKLGGAVRFRPEDVETFAEKNSQPFQENEDA